MLDLRLPVTCQPTGPQACLAETAGSGPPHLLPVLAVQVQEVGGVHPPVHALLVPCDAALDGDTLGGRPQRKLLKILDLDICRGLWGCRAGGRGCLLKGRVGARAPGTLSGCTWQSGTQSCPPMCWWQWEPGQGPWDVGPAILVLGSAASSSALPPPRPSPGWGDGGCGRPPTAGLAEEQRRQERTEEPQPEELLLGF